MIATRLAQLPSALSLPCFSAAGRAGGRPGSESARTCEGPLPASQLPLASRLPLTTDVLTALPRLLIPLQTPQRTGPATEPSVGSWQNLKTLEAAWPPSLPFSALPFHHALSLPQGQRRTGSVPGSGTTRGRMQGGPERVSVCVAGVGKDSGGKRTPVSSSVNS